MVGVTIILFALLIGIVAGLRTFTAPMAVSWAANLGWMRLTRSPLEFLGAAVTPYILTLLAVAELVADKLPQTPSRKSPRGFIARIVSGALCGTSVALAGGGVWSVGLIAGVAGAVLGTLGGYQARAGLVKAIGGRDWPIALVEDACALGGAFLIVRSL
jgi:uncharacterized membrane protein